MVLQVAAIGVFCDVVELVLKIGCVADSVFVVAGLPDFSCELFAHGVGVAAFDALDAAFNGLPWAGSNQDVQMFGHDGEAVELVAGLRAVVEEGLKEKFGVVGADEDGFALVRDECQGVGIRRWWHGELETAYRRGFGRGQNPDLPSLQRACTDCLHVFGVAAWDRAILTGGSGGDRLPLRHTAGDKSPGCVSVILPGMNPRPTCFGHTCQIVGAGMFRVGLICGVRPTELPAVEPAVLLTDSYFCAEEV